MIWLFNRGLQQVDVEVRRDPESGRYEIVLVTPDGTELIERVRNPRRLIKRTRRVQRRLIRRGWHPRSPLGLHPMPGTQPGKIARWVAMLSSMRRSVRRRLAATFGF
jgi:DNA-binding MarR family transcriptional regulator